MPVIQPHFELNLMHIADVTEAEHACMLEYLGGNERVPFSVNKVVGQPFMRLSRRDFRYTPKLGMVATYDEATFRILDDGKLDYQCLPVPFQPLVMTDGGRLHLFPKLGRGETPEVRRLDIVILNP